MLELESAEDESEAPLKLNDILYILFRHRRKIITCIITGLLLSAGFCYFNSTKYESNAKLLVRYVMEKSAFDAIDAQPDKGIGAPTENLINSEVEILTSWDLAEKVVDAVTLERLRASSRNVVSRVDAVRSIQMNLAVAPQRGSSVIAVSYRNRDPELARLVLDKLVNLYFVKHLDVHRSGGAIDFVTRETELVRGRLLHTEEEAKVLKAKAGIISLAGSMATMDAELAKSQFAIFANDVDRAEQVSRLQEIEKGLSLGDAAPEVLDITGRKDKPRNDDDGVQWYQALVSRVGQMRQVELELLAKFTPENKSVKLHQAKLEEYRKQVRGLELAHPGIAVTMASSGVNSNGSQTNVIFERARLAGINAKGAILLAQFTDLKSHAEILSEMGPTIAELDRKREFEEANYKYFGASLEKSRIDEMLDPSKIPNISVVQRPSPAVKAIGNLKKILFGFVGGGLVVGVLIALGIDLVTDNTVKRASELEGGMKLPVLLSIPFYNKESQRQLCLQEGSQSSCVQSGSVTLMPWENGHFIRTYCQAIRDRLNLHFECNRQSHKPKLVAVTGCSPDGGASTLACGLAAAFSEAGEGKVLLVDMNLSNGDLHTFFSGIPVNSLSEALSIGRSAGVLDGNLYLAKANSGAYATKVIPKHFYEMIPRLKASDYDYIIFDMPPMGPTSNTLAMAGFMDKVLLVVESEVSVRSAVRRAFKEMTNANADVSAVFNKSRLDVPEWLEA